MSKIKSENSMTTPAKRRPARTPEARENQIIAAAYDLAERQILEGTASSQVITHFLKSGSHEKQLEIEKLRNENKLLIAKVEALQSAKRVEELYEDALKAMKKYSGQGENNE